MLLHTFYTVSLSSLRPDSAQNGVNMRCYRAVRCLTLKLRRLRLSHSALDDDRWQFAGSNR